MHGCWRLKVVGFGDYTLALLERYCAVASFHFAAGDLLGFDVGTLPVILRVDLLLPTYPSLSLSGYSTESLNHLLHHHFSLQLHQPAPITFPYHHAPIRPSPPSPLSYERNLEVTSSSPSAPPTSSSSASRPLPITPSCVLRQ